MYRVVPLRLLPTINLGCIIPDRIINPDMVINRSMFSGYSYVPGLEESHYFINTDDINLGTLSDLEETNLDEIIAFCRFIVNDANLPIRNRLRWYCINTLVDYT